MFNITERLRKSKILFIVIAFFSVSGIWARDEKKSEETDKNEVYIPLPVIKIPTAVKSIKWNKTDSNFAYSEMQNIFVRDAYSLAVKQQIQAEKPVRLIKYAEYGNQLDFDQLLSFSEDNTLSVRVLPDPKPSVMKTYLESTNITAIAFSQDGTYIGLGTDSGQANLYMQLYMTGELSNRMLLNHTKLVYAVAFSPDGRFIGTASKDGTLRIWETKSASNIAVMDYISDYEFPIVFTKQGENIIVAKDLNHLSVRKFNGIETMEILCEKGIRDICLSSTGSDVIVLNNENEFEYYNLSTGEYEGFIPTWNETPVTCYDFSHDGRRLLIGHEDGSIYILDIDYVYFRRGEIPPLFKLHDVDKGKEWLYDSKNKKTEKVRGDNVTWNTSHNIDIRLAAKYTMVETFSWGIQAAAGYVNDWLIAPFYIGALIAPDLYFPNDNYKYQYSIGSIAIPTGKNPKILGIEFTLLAGKEFKIKDDFKWFVEIQGGVAMRAIHSEILGTGKWNTSMFGGAGIGLKYNIFAAHFNFTYDTITSINLNFGLSARFRIRRKVKPSYQKATYWPEPPKPTYEVVSTEMLN